MHHQAPALGCMRHKALFKTNPELTIRNFNSIKNRFIGIDSADLKNLHNVIKTIDPSDNYSNIGGSVAYALSIASVVSAAKAMNIPFYKVLNPKLDKIIPYPLGNVLGGGAHAGPGTPDLQEFLICPVKSLWISEAISLNSQIHKEVKKSIEKSTVNLHMERETKEDGPRYCK